MKYCVLQKESKADGIAPCGVIFTPCVWGAILRIEGSGAFFVPWGNTQDVLIPSKICLFAVNFLPILGVQGEVTMPARTGAEYSAALQEMVQWVRAFLQQEE